MFSCKFHSDHLQKSFIFQYCLGTKPETDQNESSFIEISAKISINFLQIFLLKNVFECSLNFFPLPHFRMKIDELPIEIMAQIFSLIEDPITASQVSLHFHLVATTHIRSVCLKLSTEKSAEIVRKQSALEDFAALKRLKLEIVYDVNNVEKSGFFNRFRDKLTHLVLREMTFLNPFFDHQHEIFENLKSLHIENSDLTSCSSQISHFIINCCPNLRNLTIKTCSGLEIESLNYIGQNLNKTCVEHFHLLPTYSYFDVSPVDSPWTIENLKTLSIRSKLVVMKKNFVKNLISRRNEKLKTLELIAELDLGESLTEKIIRNFPNLENLSLGKGCNFIKNEDFSNLCNFYQKLRKFEFHFSQSDNPLDLRGMSKNFSITELTIGLTKNITASNLTAIAKNLPNITRLNVILYYLSKSNQEFLTSITKMFPNIKQLEFQRTGMSENIKFSAIKNGQIKINIENLVN